MDTGHHRPNARDYIAELAAGGRYDFSSKDAQAALGVSADAAKLALNRLAKKGLIASPARGFHVVVPPEYRRLGSLPAEQFVPALMGRLGLAYYAGLLSAAQYHGAAHQRPQTFQVVVAGRRRAIRCGTVRVDFVTRKNAAEIPVQEFNTPRGTILVSSPEATAFDLVGYQQRAGGLDHVATILSELSELIDSRRLAELAPLSPVPWSQRLGYLLDRIGAGHATARLGSYVRQHATQPAPLIAAAPVDGARPDKNWKLMVNAEVEPDS